MENSGANRPIIPILTGPTGSGKTGVAVRLMEKYPDIHLISADSRQIYKYLNIGTDKPSADILSKYNFHLVDFVRPGERYTAFDFVRDAEKIQSELLASGKLPLICGGTGLYIKALVQGLVEIEKDDLDIRERLENEVVTKGPKYLYEKLMKVDPSEAKRVHPNNIKKIVRALEIFELTGVPKSELIKGDKRKKDKFEYKIFCLMPPREALYEKINRRVEQMMDQGLIAEVESLCEKGLKVAVERINVIGYNEIIKHINGEIGLSAALNLIRQNSRRFAKRQITWFRGMSNIIYLKSTETAFDTLDNYFADLKK